MTDAASSIASPRPAILARIRSADPVLLWGLVAAGVLFLWTLANIATRSLWWDELFTVTLAAPGTPFNETMETIRGDVHPPYYFLAERVWLTLLNTSSEVAARALNLIPYAFAGWAAWWGFQRRIAQPLAMWFVLFFTSFGFLWYLQEARMYAFMIAQSFAGLLMVLDFETRKDRRIDWAYGALLAATFVVMPLGHWFSVGFAGMLLLGLCAWAFLAKRMSYFWLFFSAGCALAFLGAAWIVSNFSHTLGAAGGYGGHIYGGELSLWGIRTTLTGILLYGLTLNPVLIAAAAFGVWTFITGKTRPTSLIVIAAVSVLLSVAIFAISVISPMYQTRNFVFLIAPLTLFAAIGLERGFALVKGRRSQQAMAVILLIAVNTLIAPLAARFVPLELDAWRQAGRYVTAQPGCATAQVPVLTEWLKPADPAAKKKQSQRIYGYYGGDPDRLRLVMPGDTLALDAREACPVALWAAQMPLDDAKKRALEVFGPAAAGLQVVHFPGHAVFVRELGQTAEAAN